MTATSRAATTDRADVRQMETPSALVSAAGLPRVDFTDTFALRPPPGSSRDAGCAISPVSRGLAVEGGRGVSKLPPYLSVLTRVELPSYSPYQ